ncbi:nucleotidyltransferase family protein [Thalassotalea ponticola]|uniref:nucleotidyltransferase family protein n=1 Tax=Thalassotalea ponticola TaxID=1523392 RepID=UPI0025B623E7|nr:nucleotidyltransferase family protein [Thalassotalea ponticola]MDN3652637.1 nucleotidyltransferase family protein [Thalassotalea ponticola]
MLAISQQLLDDISQWFDHRVPVSAKLISRLHHEPDLLALIAFLNEHWLLGAFVDRLKQANVFVQLEPELQHYLEHISEFYQTRNEALQQEVINVVSLLQQANINAIVLKGAAGLFNQTFVPLSTRFMTDIDILVPSDQQQQAIATLLKQGYWQDKDELDIAAKNHHHAPPLSRDNNGLCNIEVHQWPIQKRWHAILSPEQVWQTAKPLPLITTKETNDLNLCALQLAPTEQMILAIAHCELSHRAFSEQQIDFRQLHNSACLIKRFHNQINWQQVQRQFSQQQQLLPLQAHLLMVQKFFAQSTPINCQSPQAIEHLNRCVTDLIKRQGKISPWRMLKGVLQGYSKQHIDVMYGAVNYWQLSKGRLQHAKRHLKMLSKPDYLKAFINRLRQ